MDSGQTIVSSLLVAQAIPKSATRKSCTMSSINLFTYGEIEALFNIKDNIFNIKFEFQFPSILLNIFGGIVRCDRVANGVVQAYKNIGEISVPIVVRLQGTNSEEGAKIIKESGLEVFSTNTLQDAADKINEILKK